MAFLLLSVSATMDPWENDNKNITKQHIKHVYIHIL